MSFTLADAFVYFRSDSKDLEKGLDSAEQKTNSAVSNMTKALGGILVGGVTLAASAIAGIGAAAFDVASDIDAATDQIAASLGLTNAEAKKFGATIKQVYGDNWGDSIEDVGAAVEQVAKRLKLTADDPSLGKITAGAIALRDTFEIEVSESIDAVNTLMQNFGLTSTQAMDYLVEANQRGLNSSDDLLDTIGEYSVQFSNAGASASEFFKFLEEGNAGGILGTDKAADAVKEFGIRILDNSTLTKDSLAAIGISYDDLTQGFKDGSKDQFAAMQDILYQIFKLEDPIQRATVGVGLFGTQWEDLGEDAMRALSEIEEGFGSVDGATDTLNTKYTNLGSVAEGMWRKFQVGIAPAGEAMLEFVNEHLLEIEGVVGTVSGKVVTFIGMIPLALLGIKTAWNEDWAGMRTTVEDFSNDMPVKLQGMWTTIDELFQREGESTGEGWERFVRGLFGTADTTLRNIVDIVDNRLQTMKLFFTAIGSAISGDWEGFWNGMFDFAESHLELILDLIQNIWGPDLRDSIVHVLHDVWYAMQLAWKDISDWWNDTFGGLLGIEASTPNLAIVNPLNTVQGQINAIINSQPSLIPGQFSPQAQTQGAGVNIGTLQVVAPPGGDPFETGREIERGIEYERRIRGE